MGWRGWILSVIHNPASLTATAIEGGPIVILGPERRYDISLGDPLAIPCITSDLSLAIVMLFEGGTRQEITPFIWGVNYEAAASFYTCGVEGSLALFTQSKSVWGRRGEVKRKGREAVAGKGRRGG